MNTRAAVPDSEDGSPTRQHRGLAPGRAGRERGPSSVQELDQPTLHEGQTVLEGVVKNITDYGAFVDLGGVDGLLHVTDMAHGAGSITRARALTKSVRR